MKKITAEETKIIETLRKASKHTNTYIANYAVDVVKMLNTLELVMEASKPLNEDEWEYINNLLRNLDDYTAYNVDRINKVIK